MIALQIILFIVIPSRFVIPNFLSNYILSEKIKIFQTETLPGRCGEAKIAVVLFT